MRIDAHLHLWRLADGYPWLAPDLGPLYRDVELGEALGELNANQIDAAVLVQAADHPADTEAMLAAKAASSRILGVVGWVPLDDPAACAAALARYGSRLCGVRHLVHDEPRRDFLELAPVRESLALVAQAGLAFDVPDAWPHHLHQAVALARALPQLRVVIDHLAKPPVTGMPDWRTGLAAAAELPNVVAKVSGLQQPGVALSTEGLRPAWDAAVELFGPDRMMYGGDWPMTTREHGGYAVWRRAIAPLIDQLPPEQAERVWCGCAAEVYRLETAC